MRRMWAISVALCAAVAAAPADPIGSRQRAQYVAGLVEAMRGSDYTTLVDTTKYIRAAERNDCQASEQSLRVGCLVEAAAVNCRQAQGAVRDRCPRVSDIIMTNLLSEEAFIPRDVRLQIMNKHQDPRAALARELERRYAMLVTEFAMSDHFPGSTAPAPALAAGLDRFCRDTADTQNLSWQYCVAAVLWVIGTEGKTANKTAKGATK